MAACRATRQVQARLLFRSGCNVATVCSRSCGWLQSGDAGDSITLYPSKLDPRCEALVFVLSAADSEVALLDLNTPDVLSFEGFSTGEGFSTAVLCLKAADQ